MGESYDFCGELTLKVVDLGICNLTSLTSALDIIGVDYEVVRRSEELGENCDGIILPGVGAFEAGMKSLSESKLDQKIKSLVNNNVPLIGVCLGMQLLFDKSYEFGEWEGLGLIPGEVKRIKPLNPKFRVPNIGWSEVSWVRSSPINRDCEESEAFYFVHSYSCNPTDPDDIKGVVDIGNSMVAVVQRENIFGVQFHPEKSLDSGLALMAKYAQFCIAFKS